MGECLAGFLFVSFLGIGRREIRRGASTDARGDGLELG